MMLSGNVINLHGLAGGKVEQTLHGRHEGANDKRTRFCVTPTAHSEKLEAIANFCIQLSVPELRTILEEVGRRSRPRDDQLNASNRSS